MARTADDRTGKPQQFWRFSTLDNKCSQSHFACTGDRDGLLCEDGVPKEKMMDDMEIGKYLAEMKPYEFWKLVREHRTDDIGKFLEAMKWYEFWKLVRKHRPWLTTAEAAAYLGMKPRTLVSWRWLKGPRPVQKGKFIHYHLDVLDAWRTTETQPNNGADAHSAVPPTAVV